LLQQKLVLRNSKENWQMMELFVVVQEPGLQMIQK
jgi:hypothetical protein